MAKIVFRIKKSTAVTILLKIKPTKDFSRFWCNMRRISHLRKGQFLNFHLTLYIMNWYSRTYILGMILLAATALTGCEKSENLVERQTSIAFAQFSKSAGETALKISGADVTGVTLRFGELSGSPDSPYIKTGAGFRQVNVQPSTGSVYPTFNTILPEAGYISYWLYDTADAAGTKGPALLQLVDRLSSDTARTNIRFLQLATNIDTLSLFFVKNLDTLKVAQEFTLPHSKTSRESLASFVPFTKSGTYDLKIFDKPGNLIRTIPDVEVQKNASYTVCTTGVFDPNQPSLLSIVLIRHK